MSLTYRTYLFLWVIMSHYALMGIKHPKMHYMVKHKGRCMMPQLIWVELYFCLRDTFYKQTRCNTKCTDTAELDFLSCNSYLLYNSVTGPLVRHINILLLLLSIMLKPSSVYLLQLTQENSAGTPGPTSNFKAFGMMMMIIMSNPHKWNRNEPLTGCFDSRWRQRGRLHRR